MNISDVAKSTQEQAVAAWIDHLNQLRIDELMANLTKQDINLSDALNTLEALKLSINALVNSNRGGEKGIHGFIAERTEVAIENARKLIKGLKPEYVLLDDNGPVDLLRNDVPIQQKFVQESLSLKAIREHFEKYPDFIKCGGKYQIPKDFYDLLQKYAAMTPEESKKLLRSGGERKLYDAVQKLLKESGIGLDDIEPSVLDYKDPQRNKIEETLEKEKGKIKETDKAQRQRYYEKSKPTMQEGAKAAGVSAAIEGGMAFCLAVAQKRKEGKLLAEFSEDDWREVGIGTTKGTAAGAVRGATVYTLTNFTATPAAVASAFVTASFGMAAQAQLLHQGKITSEEFVDNSEIVCLDVTVSAIASVMGQVIIPIPVLGALLGNTVGMFMYGIAKNNLEMQDQMLAHNYLEGINKLNIALDEHYKAFIALLMQEFTKYKSIVDFAFDLNVNTAFAASIELAQYAGCAEGKILKNKDDIDAFFLG